MDRCRRDRALGRKEPDQKLRLRGPRHTEVRLHHRHQGSEEHRRCADHVKRRSRTRSSARQSEALDLLGGGEARVRMIDPGMSWSVIITSPFLRIPCNTITPGGSNARLGLSSNARNGQVVMDRYLAFGPNVLSIATITSQDMLISMIPGPWEADLFGLPLRRRSAKVKRRISKRAAAVVTPDSGNSNHLRTPADRRDHGAEVVCWEVIWERPYRQLERSAPVMWPCPAYRRGCDMLANRSPAFRFRRLTTPSAS